MKLTDLTITEFMDKMGSSSPTPGGGSAAALQGAQGAALGSMVCALTLGKKKYADVQELAAEKKQKLDGLKEQFLDMIQQDIDAFNGVAAVFAMPKETQEEKLQRRQAMQKALKSCTIPPYETMELCLVTLEEIDFLMGKTYTGAVSDLGVAALSLKAAVQSAWLNVLINIGGIEDEAFACEHRKKGEAILARAVPLADSIYEQTCKSL